MVKKLAVIGSMVSLLFLSWPMTAANADIPEDFKALECLLIPQKCETCPPNCLFQEREKFASKVRPSGDNAATVERSVVPQAERMYPESAPKPQWNKAVTATIGQRVNMTAVPIPPGPGRAAAELVALQNPRRPNQVCLLQVEQKGKETEIKNLRGGAFATMSTTGGGKISTAKPPRADQALAQFTSSCTGGTMANDGIGSCIWNYDPGGIIPDTACVAVFSICAVIIAADCVGDHW